MANSKGYVLVERNVRGILTRIYELEREYQAQRVYEIARNISDKSPMLSSRITSKRIHNFIMRARQIESRHNRGCTDDDDMVNIVEAVIVEDDNFPLSKTLLYKIWERADSIKAGIDARRRIPYSSSIDSLIPPEQSEKLVTTIDWDAVFASVPKLEEESSSSSNTESEDKETNGTEQEQNELRKDSSEGVK
jgi:hypothetical protein